MRMSLLLAFIGCALMATPQDKERWDKKYSVEGYHSGTEPVAFLKENLPLLHKGKALDLAMGDGRNAVFLAKNGFDVTGVDISEKGIAKALELARQSGVTLRTVVADLDTYDIPKASYDLIVITYYLDRTLYPKAKAALKPGGAIVIEQYTEEYLKINSHFKKEYVLRRGELLESFKDLNVIKFQNLVTNDSAFASLLAYSAR